MSIETTKSKIAKLQAEIEKAELELEKKGAKLIAASGLLDLDISEKELKKELKELCTNLRNKLKKK